MSNARELALVTGASSGIGFELAKRFAEHGYDLVVNAEDAGLDSAAEELTTIGVDVRAVRADLRTGEGVEQFHTAVRAIERPVSVAAVNAGVGQGGAFVDTGLTEQLEVIDLNVRSTVHLTKLLLADMVARDEGRILITSSIASTMPGSFHAVYNASKAFLQSFAEAVRDETKNSGVTITSLMPGPTETDFFHRAGMDHTRVGRSRKDDPAEVAEQAYAALMEGRGKVVAGSVWTKVQAAANGFLPDRLKAAAHRLMADPGATGR